MIRRKLVQALLLLLSVVKECWAPLPGSLSCQSFPGYLISEQMLFLISSHVNFKYLFIERFQSPAIQKLIFFSASTVLIKLLPHGCFFQTGWAQRGQPEWKCPTQHLTNAQRLLTEGMSFNRTWQLSCYARGFKWEKRISRKWTATLSLVCGESQRIIIWCPIWFASLSFLEVFWPNRAVVSLLLLFVAVHPHPCWD